MSDAADPDRVAADLANLRGRLHPSQRRVVLTGARPGYVCLVLGIGFLVLTPLAPNSPAALGYLVAAVLLAGAAWIAGRRLLDLLLGRVEQVRGWTTVEVHQDRPARGYYTGPSASERETSRLSSRYTINVGAESFLVPWEVYAITQPDRNCVLFRTAVTRRAVNIVPAGS